MKGIKNPDDQPLTRLLEECFKSPKSIPLRGSLKRSGILALCLHCLMIKAGFKSAEDKSLKPRFMRLGALFGRNQSAFTPPPSWLCLLPSTEFIFRYTYPGMEGVFVLHCSLDERSQRLYVQVSEVGNRVNAQVMGLHLAKSVPDSRDYREATCSGIWAGVVTDQRSVVDMFTTYVTDPLLQKVQLSKNHNAKHIEESGAQHGLGLAPKLIGLGLAVVVLMAISRTK